MRITENSASAGLLHHLQRLQAGQIKEQEKVVTGQRILRTSDDPEAARRALEIQSEAATLRQYQKNGALAMERSEAVHAGLSSLKQISDTVGKLAVKGGGMVGPEGRATLALEIDQLIEEAVSVLNARTGGDTLFGGTNTSPFTVSRDGAGRAISVAAVDLAENQGIPIGRNALVRVGPGGEDRNALAGFINGMIALREELRDGSVPADATRTNLLEGEETVIRLMGENGAAQARLDAFEHRTAASLLHLEEGLSRVIDADMTETILRFSSLQAAYQAALQTSGKMIGQSLLNYI